MPKKLKKPADTVVYPGDSSVTIKKNGTLAWRNSNPGNVMCGSFAKKLGSIGCNGKAIFPDMKTGENAQVALLKRQKYQSQSIAGAIEAYAPSKDHNDTEKYIKSVAKWTGMSRDKALSSMTPPEFNNFVSGIRRYEGLKLGTQITLPASNGGPIAGEHSRTLKRVGDTVYRIENGKTVGSFTCDGKKK